MIALITGSSKGIGKEIALAFAKEGHDICINYRGNKEKAEQTVEEIKKFGVRAIAVQADVSDYEACLKMQEKIHEEMGEIDILVNNAGITKDRLILKMKPEDFDDVIHANLYSVFNTIKVFSREMLKKRYGKIINISSVVGLHGNPGQVNYSASKAGIIGITKTMAKELSSKNIYVNAIAPGFIESDMTDQLNESIRENVLDTIPLKRFGKASEVAELAAFLASNRSDYITGQVFAIDGGMSI